MTRSTTDFPFGQVDAKLCSVHGFLFPALSPPCKILTSLGPGAHSRVSLRVHDVQNCSQNLKTKYRKTYEINEIIALAIGAEISKSSPRASQTLIFTEARAHLSCRFHFITRPPAACRKFTSARAPKCKMSVSLQRRAHFARC